MKKISVYLILLLSIIPVFCLSQPVETKISDGIAYTIAGDGPLLVFIHGSNLDRRMWTPQVEHFSDDFKVITYDLHGHGASETPTEPYSDASDLSQLLNEEGEPKATLIGLSAGTQVALDFALQWPERVEQLVLVSPSLFGFTPDTPPSYLPDLIAALQNQEYDMANTLLLDSPIMAVPSEYKDLVRDMVTSSRQWTFPYALIQQNPEPFISNLHKIDVPVLILVGDKDIQAVHEVAEHLHNKLPNADMRSIADGLHLLNLSHPDAFHSELLRFFEQ